jgi:hypothetical protein
MDPNVCLVLMREIAAKTVDDRHPNLDAAASAAYRMAELFEGLDQWIKQGGFLPDDWKQKPDRDASPDLRELRSH